jgi:hypothetical protein
MTMKKLLCLAAVLLAAGWGLAALQGVAGEGKKKPGGGEPAAGPAADPKGRDIADLMLAYRLVEIGRDKKNPAPEALITAAGLFRKLAKVSMTTITDKPMIEPAEGADKGAKLVDETAKAPDLQAKADELFDEAEALGAKLKLNLAPLIKQTKERVSDRSPVGGPRTVARVIGGKQTHVFRFDIHAHQPTHFGIRASIPLRVSVVRSDNDNPMAAGVIAIGEHTWVPGGNISPVPITIRITNLSTQPAEYQFLLN